MSKNCVIMQRMKENYENRSKYFLTRRTPVIIRIDGKAFHTFTKHLNKPFDEGLIEDMEETTKFLCKNIQGVKFGYCQSDEINLLLTDYDTLQTQAWFDYNLQKIVSISASLATAKFNELRSRRDVPNQTLAFFDSRAFSIPKEEIVNYFIARQKDAIKNSISMLAQSLYSSNELHKKNNKDMLQMCLDKGVDWNSLYYKKKYGCSVIKSLYVNDIKMVEVAEGVFYTYRPDVFNNIQSKVAGEYVYRKGEHLYFAEFKSDVYENSSGTLYVYENDTTQSTDYKEIPVEKIRNKWNSIETPEKFDGGFFVNNLRMDYLNFC